MPRVLVAQCIQEVSTFNPIESVYDDFVVHRGEALVAAYRGVESEVDGALGVFRERGDVRVIPAYAARASTSGGVLARGSFARLCDEFLSAVRSGADGVDGVYFSLHGAMSASGELDPEGYLLEESRRILGEGIPIVVSLDLHGILTDRMLTHCDAVTMLRTYPHVDFVDNGQRAARLLLEILDEGARPVMATVPIPALVRGNELITETGVYGQFVRDSAQLEASGAVMGAGFMIGNPFTDVPELCSQPVVITNNDAERAEREALRLARDFWALKERMQPELMELASAVEAAKGVDGPVIFTDAADAPSSGATGDSNAILAALLNDGYEKTVLLPLVDPLAVRRAFEAGVGRVIKTPLGGALDPARFAPVELEVTVDMLSRGQVYFESWGSLLDAGDTAVLKTPTMTLVVTSRPVHLFDRSLFLSHGQDPRRFDLIVVKSPHCQAQFFDAWAAKNFNVDAPGSTSANLRTLGHTICRRPMYPLDEDVSFVPKARVFGPRG
jgi:microcystin degradation protein MlrC